MSNPYDEIDPGPTEDQVMAWNIHNDHADDAADESDWDEDGHQAHKDGVGMGYINPDGSQREPDEPDWGLLEYERHLDEAHGGGACDCPPSARPDPWASEPAHSGPYSDEPPF